MGLSGIKSFYPAERILFGYFLLPLRLPLKLRFSHVWREAVPLPLPEHCPPLYPPDSVLVDETLPFSYGLDDCPPKSIILYCIKPGGRIETSYDLTAVLNRLHHGSLPRIGRRPGLCVWRGEKEIINHLSTKHWGHMSTISWSQRFLLS